MSDAEVDLDYFLRRMIVAGDPDEVTRQLQALRNRAGFETNIAKLGAPASQQGAAVAYPIPGAEGAVLWTLIQDDLVLVATDIVALQRGGKTAIQLHGAAAPAGDLIVTTWPQRIRALVGVDFGREAERAGQKLDAPPSRQTSVTYKRAPKALPKAAEQRSIFGKEDDEPVL
jgi:hypothetical protein